MPLSRVGSFDSLSATVAADVCGLPRLAPFLAMATFAIGVSGFITAPLFGKCLVTLILRKSVSSFFFLRHSPTFTINEYSAFIHALFPHDSKALHVYKLPAFSVTESIGQLIVFWTHLNLEFDAEEPRVSSRASSSILESAVTISVGTGIVTAH